MSEENLTQIMQSIKNNFSSSLATISAMAEAKSKTIPEECFKQHPNNVEKFTDCLTTSQKKINTVMDEMNFKLYFISRTAKACLLRGSSLDDCLT